MALSLSESLMELPPTAIRIDSSQGTPDHNGTVSSVAPFVWIDFSGRHGE
jgi:hypothetical protein